MKRLLIFLLLFSCAGSKSICQPYRSLFGQTQTSWNVAYFIMSDWTLTDSLVIGNDTIINSNIYKSVKCFGSFDFSGFIREDTMTGRAWYLDNSWLEKEFLIMDLSLTVGDTFILHKMQFPEDSITTVDSVNYVGANKVVYLSDNSNYFLPNGILSFIEGVGPNAGIIFQLYKSAIQFSDGCTLLCSYKENIQTYNSGGPCYVLYGGIKENQFDNSQLTIFPNPTSDKIQIEYHGQLPYCLEIVDYTGKIIDSKDKINLSKCELDFANFSKGLYFIKAYGQDRILTLKKVIKN